MLVEVYVGGNLDGLVFMAESPEAAVAEARLRFPGQVLVAEAHDGDRRWGFIIGQAPAVFGGGV